MRVAGKYGCQFAMTENSGDQLVSAASTREDRDHLVGSEPLKLRWEYGRRQEGAGGGTCPPPGISKLLLLLLFISVICITYED